MTSQLKVTQLDDARLELASSKIKLQTLEKRLLALYINIHSKPQ